MKKFSILFLLIFNTFFSQEKKVDYSKLESVYSEFVLVMKTKDDKKLKTFSENISPTENTLNYMRKHNLCYRGIPCIMDKKMMKISFFSDKVYLKLLEFRNRLNKEDYLSTLSLIPRKYEHDTDVINGIPIYSTEEGIFLNLDKDYSFIFPLGEMLFINGRWCLFTLPQVNESINPRKTK